MKISTCDLGILLVFFFAAAFALFSFFGGFFFKLVQGFIKKIDSKIVSLIKTNSGVKRWQFARVLIIFGIIFYVIHFIPSVGHKTSTYVAHNVTVVPCDTVSNTIPKKQVALFDCNCSK